MLRNRFTKLKRISAPEKGVVFDTRLPKALCRSVIGQTKSDGLLVFVVLGRTNAKVSVVALKIS